MCTVVPLWANHCYTVSSTGGMLSRVRAPTLRRDFGGLDPGGDQFGVPVWTPPEIYTGPGSQVSHHRLLPPAVCGHRPFRPLLGLRPALS